MKTALAYFSTLLEYFSETNETVSQHIQFHGQNDDPQPLEQKSQEYPFEPTCSV
jgi:hypothetical protein